MAPHFVTFLTSPQGLELVAWLNRLTKEGKKTDAPELSAASGDGVQKKELQTFKAEQDIVLKASLENYQQKLAKDALKTGLSPKQKEEVVGIVENRSKVGVSEGRMLSSIAYRLTAPLAEFGPIPGVPRRVDSLSGGHGGGGQPSQPAKDPSSAGDDKPIAEKALLKSSSSAKAGAAAAETPTGPPPKKQKVLCDPYPFTP